MNARAGPPDIQGHVVLIVDDNPNNLRVMSDLLRKAPEAQTLGSKDVLLAKVVLDIHRKRTRSEFVCVPLFMVKQIHPIDRDIAIEATEKRIEAVRTHRQRILGQGVITREILGKVLPSVSWIKVVQQDPETYIAYEGNGRLVALQKVFSPDDDLRLEVEQYMFRNPAKIIGRMNRIRAMHGLV